MLRKSKDILCMTRGVGYRYMEAFVYIDAAPNMRLHILYRQCKCHKKRTGVKVEYHWKIFVRKI